MYIPDEVCGLLTTISEKKVTILTNAMADVLQEFLVGENAYCGFSVQQDPIRVNWVGLNEAYSLELVEIEVYQWVFLFCFGGLVCNL